MTTNTKTQNGIRYRLVKQDSLSIADDEWIWHGHDGSTLELTETEKAEHAPKTHSVTD